MPGGHADISSRRFKKQIRTGTRAIFTRDGSCARKRDQSGSARGAGDKYFDRQVPDGDLGAIDQAEEVMPVSVPEVHDVSIKALIERLASLSP
jgi:hypothetical protein